jgi:hypothetical protein
LARFTGKNLKGVHFVLLIANPYLNLSPCITLDTKAPLTVSLKYFLAHSPLSSFGKKGVGGLDACIVLINKALVCGLSLPGQEDAT